MHPALSRAAAVAPARPGSSLPAGTSLLASQVGKLRRLHSVRLTRALRADALRRAVSSNYHVACGSGYLRSPTVQGREPVEAARGGKCDSGAVPAPALERSRFKSGAIRGLVRLEDKTPWLSVRTILLLPRIHCCPREPNHVSHRMQLATSVTLSPNPSVERTANGGSLLFASATVVPPLSAAHLKR